jgi:4-amino-4-deoxy-L-arabinose transferase-like glycosyltransferase
VIFYPSLFVFFTNDDFFFLKIAQAKSLGDFLNFFNLIKRPDGFGMYRPLTTQVFYFLGGKNPLAMHIISFIFFFGIIYLVYKLALELFKNEKVALISAFLYGVSATHFGNLYYLATFQELGMTFFVLLSCLSFLKNKNLLSFIFFILAIMSKETAVITPLLLLLIYFFQKNSRRKAPSFRKLLLCLVPFVICIFAYLLIRFRWYGFPSGDSYVWNFSIIKAINTSFWYLLWSLNIPESLIDFVGPGLKINANLFLYWGKEIIPILLLFCTQGILLAVVLVRALLEKTKKEIEDRDLVSVFCISWFLISLLPVAFLPLHKFTFYLTLPLIGLVFRISYLLVTSKANNIFIILFLVVWTATSILTLRFTVETNWITQEEIISKKVFDYFELNKSKYVGKQIVFVDTKEDATLPWSPTETVKTSLSATNFFYVFFPELANRVSYSGKGEIVIQSRQFLGY